MMMETKVEKKVKSQKSKITKDNETTKIVGNKDNKANKPVGKEDNKTKNSVVNKEQIMTEHDDNPGSTQNFNICGQKA